MPDENDTPAPAAPPTSTQADGPRGAVAALTRAADLAPSSFREDDLSVELVFTTGAAVRRQGWDGERWVEELEVSDAAVDLARLNAGAPLLDSHASYGLRNQVGVVERAWLEDGVGKARVRFSRRPELAGLIQDVREGIVRNVSVGYAVHTWRDVTEAEDTVRTWRAIRWEPLELSLVSIPADAGAQTRSAAGQSNPPAEGERETSAASAPLSPQGDATMPDDNRAAIEAATNEARSAERARVQGIGDLARRLKLGDEFVRTHVDAGTELEAARAAAIDAVADRSEREAPPTFGHVSAGADRRDHVRAGVASALLHRHNPTDHKLEDVGREFRGYSLLELARLCCEVEGIRTQGMGKMELARAGLHSTSDFPLILANVANKRLRAAYEAAPQTFRPWVRPTTRPDFKSASVVQLGDAPSLLKVPEGGEIKRGTIGEAAESYALATYGRIVAVTRQTIVNDDLGAFTRLPEMFGRAAADLESDLVYAQIITNPTMADGTALFHADHGNLGSGVISVTSLGAGRAAMRKQTGLGGRLINVQASFLLVPPELETLAQQFTSSAYVPNQSSTINPFTSLTPIAEPRLTDAAPWYLVASPGQVDTVELAYLDGQQGVYLESRVGFDVDGLELKARLDAASKVIDWRGFFKSTGA